MQTDYYRRWCNLCLCVHWVEVSPDGRRETCHGENFFPRDDKTQYIKAAPDGGIRVIEKISFSSKRAPTQQLPLEWQLLQDAEYPPTHPTHKRSQNV